MGESKTLILAYADDKSISPETDTAIAMTTAELYLARAREKSARLKNLLDPNYSYTTMQDYFQMEKTEEPAYEVLRGFLGDINSGLEREGSTHIAALRHPAFF